MSNHLPQLDDDLEARRAEIASYREKRRQRKARQRLLRVGLFALGAALVGGLAFVLAGNLHGGSAPSLSNAASSVPASVPAATLWEPVSSAPLPQEGLQLHKPRIELPPTYKELWDFPAEVQPLPEGQAPDRRMLALPENGRVSMEYFDTVVFVGDSLTQGLQIYKQGVPNAHYCAYKGISPKQVYDGSIQTRLDGEREVPMDALVGYAPDNVYVLLGTNAMVGMSNEALLAYYSQMLDVMKERLGSEVGIYVQSITPVLQGVDRRFNFDDIKYLNDQLALMAVEKGLYFLDLHEALAGDDGWMRWDYGAPRDGYHMQAAGYAAWVEYLVTHTVYNPRHAHLYVEGTPYQQAPPAE